MKNTVHKTWSKFGIPVMATKLIATSVCVQQAALTETGRRPMKFPYALHENKTDVQCMILLYQKMKGALSHLQTLLSCALLINNCRYILIIVLLKLCFCYRGCVRFPRRTTAACSAPSTPTRRVILRSQCMGSGQRSEPKSPLSLVQLRSVW